MVPFSKSIGIVDNKIALNQQAVRELLVIAQQGGLTAYVQQTYLTFLERAQQAAQNRKPRELSEVQQQARATKNRLLGRV